MRINHASVYAHDPKRAAEHLAALAGGVVRSFHPCDGGWACLLEGEWNGALIEFYPRTATLAHEGGHVRFEKLDPPARGGGTHFNLSLEKSRAEVEAICGARGLTHAWRDWAGFLDVWLDDELLIECVCEG